VVVVVVVVVMVVVVVVMSLRRARPLQGGVWTTRRGAALVCKVTTAGEPRRAASLGRPSFEEDSG